MSTLLESRMDKWIMDTHIYSMCVSVIGMCLRWKSNMLTEIGKSFDNGPRHVHPSVNVWPFFLFFNFRSVLIYDCSLTGNYSHPYHLRKVVYCFQFAYESKRSQLEIVGMEKTKKKCEDSLWRKLGKIKSFEPFSKAYRINKFIFFQFNISISQAYWTMWQCC